MAFGSVSEIGVGKSSTGVVAGDFNGDHVTDLAAFGVRQISILYAPSDSAQYPPLLIQVPEPIDRVFAADCNRDGVSDLIVLTSNPRKIRTYISTRDSIVARLNLRLTLPGENVIVQDVNNDRKADVLVFGKKSLGVDVLLGNGDGSFRSPKNILADFSFSELLPIDINVDRTIDFLAFDWIRSELLVFTGIGQLRFSQPSSVSLLSEPIGIAACFADIDNNMDLLTVHPTERACMLFVGDGFGGFASGGMIPLRSVPSRFTVGDVNEDEKPDIVTLSEVDRTLEVHLNDGDGTFGRRISYSAGSRPADMVLIKNSGEACPRAVVTDRERQSLLVYSPASERITDPAEQAYPVGARPLGIAVLDVNADGRADLLVANNKSSDLSLLLGRGDGSFYGQIAVPHDAGAEQLFAFNLSDSMVAAVTTHPSEGKLVINRVAFPSLGTDLVAVSTRERPEILRLLKDEQRNDVRVVLAGFDESAKTVVLSEVVQVGKRQFVERRLFSADDAIIEAADVGDMNGDGLADVVCIATEPGRRKGNVFVSRGQKSGRFAQPALCFALRDTGVQNAHLWVRSLTPSESPDLIVQYRSSERWVALSNRRDDSTYAMPYQTFRQVSVRSRNDISFYDIDRDGVKDLIVANALTKTIQVYLGKEKGLFSEPQRLISFPSEGGFVVSDFNNDGIADYAVVFSESGLVRVYLGR
jgi:hypothetical protein